VQTSGWQKQAERWTPPILLLAAAALLLFDLGGRALWWDEIINVLIDQQDIRGILTSLGAVRAPAAQVDVHPPVFHLLQHFWIGWAGSSDLAVRLPNALFALVALALLYRIACTLDGATTGKLALLVAGFAPFWLLYARMARYYALTAMLSLASVILYLKLLKRPTRTLWAAYLAVNVVMLYTDYLVATLLVCQVLYLAWARPGRRWLATWAGIMAVVGLAYTPWLPAWHSQATLMNSIVEADLSRGLVGMALKFAVPIASFTIGETILPWELPGVLGYLLFAGLWISGLLYLSRRAAPADWPGARLPFILIVTSVPALGTIAVITFVTPTITFIGIGNRTFFAFPFLALLTACGLHSVERRAARAAAIVILVAIYGYAAGNYFANRHFFNPVYAVPTKTVLTDIMAQARPGDAIVSDGDTGLGYYFQKQARDGVTHYYFGSPEGRAALQAIAHDLATHHPPQHSRLFVVTMGRDRTRRDLPAEFTQTIEPAAHVTWERGYTPQDATLRQIKQRLIGREDYQFKLMVRLYELP